MKENETEKEKERRRNVTTERASKRVEENIFKYSILYIIIYDGYFPLATPLYHRLIRHCRTTCDRIVFIEIVDTH